MISTEKIKIRRECAEKCLKQAIKTQILEDIEHAIKLSKSINLNNNQLLIEAKEIYHHEKIQRELMISQCLKQENKNVWYYICKDNRKKMENVREGKSKCNFRSSLPIWIKKKKKGPILERPKGFKSILNKQNDIDFKNNDYTKSYHQQFDFGEFNRNFDKNDKNNDNVIINGFEDKESLKIELNDLKSKLKHEKVKAKKYKQIYQKLKLKLEETPYDQRLNEKFLSSKQKAKQHLTNYDKLLKMVKNVKNKLEYIN